MCVATATSTSSMPVIALQFSIRFCGNKWTSHTVWLLCGEHVQYTSLDMITKPHNPQYSMWNLLNVDTVVHSEHFWIFLPFPDRETMHIFKRQMNMNISKKAKNAHIVSCCQRVFNYEVSSFHSISYLSFYDCQKPLQMYKKGEQTVHNCCCRQMFK